MLTPISVSVGIVISVVVISSAFSFSFLFLLFFLFAFNDGSSFCRSYSFSESSDGGDIAGKGIKGCRAEVCAVKREKSQHGRMVLLRCLLN